MSLQIVILTWSESIIERFAGYLGLNGSTFLKGIESLRQNGSVILTQIRCLFLSLTVGNGLITCAKVRLYIKKVIILFLGLLTYFTFSPVAVPLA